MSGFSAQNFKDRMVAAAQRGPAEFLPANALAPPVTLAGTARMTTVKCHPQIRSCRLQYLLLPIKCRHRGQDLAKKQKLRGEQITQLEAFLNDVQTVREGKLFCLLLALQTDIGAIIMAAPPFAVSAELKKNIEAFVVAVMLSPKLGMYKGDVPVQHVMNNPADMGKLKSVVQYYCTQHRSSCKKQLFASVRVAHLNENGEKMTVDLPPDQHQNLFALAQSFVDGTKCRITNALCGRIALMRSVYLESSGQTFWSDLDKALGLMREAGKGSDEARDAMFEVLIETDKELHGAVEIVYQNNDNIQQEVDDLIHASAANAASTPANPASSIAPQGGPEPDAQEE
ncbi:hypothetical protein B0H13DRAFT_2393217 [Mycena leptocephala]|nr:hypothetical protein B0H13DRAFT_2393217 [Mycena leptocephala]